MCEAIVGARPSTLRPTRAGVHRWSDVTTSWRSSGPSGGARVVTAAEVVVVLRRRRGRQDPAVDELADEVGARGDGGANHLPRVRRARGAARGSRHHPPAGRTGHERGRRARQVTRWRVAIPRCARSIPRLHWRRSNCGHSAGCSRRRARRAPCSRDRRHAPRRATRCSSYSAELMARVVDVPVMLVLAGRGPTGEWLGRFPACFDGPRGARSAAATPPRSRTPSYLSARWAPRPPPRSWIGPGATRSYVRELMAMVQPPGRAGGRQRPLRAGRGAALPPSLQAILAARLDALGGDREDRGATRRRAGQRGRRTRRSSASARRGPRGPAGRSSLTGLLRQDRDGRYDVADPLLREVAYETLPARCAPIAIARPRTSRRPSRTRPATSTARAGYRPDDEALVERKPPALWGPLASSSSTTPRPATACVSCSGPSSLATAIRGPAAPGARVRRAGSRTTEELRVLELVPVKHAMIRRSMRSGCTRRHGRWSCAPPEAALAGLDAAAARWAELGNREKQGWALSNKGVVLFNMGRVAEAQVALEAGLELFLELGYRPGSWPSTAFSRWPAPTISCRGLVERGVARRRGPRRPHRPDVVAAQPRMARLHPRSLRRAR